MQNFFKNAKQMLDAGQAIAKNVSDLRAAQQQQAAQSVPRSRSRSRSNESKKEPAKAQNVDIGVLTRIDSEQCFSAMQCSEGFFHVVYVEGGMSVLKIGDREKAISYRNQLNHFKSVAKIAYQQNTLHVFAEQASTRSNWPEVCLASLLGLEDAVDLLCKGDPLVTTNLAVPDTGLLPLHISIQQENLPVSLKLLSYGADLRKCDLSTHNCLHYAVKNNFAFVKALYAAKPDQFVEALDGADSDDLTPFHFALKQDADDTVQLVKSLIKCGANSSLVNVDIAELGVSLKALNTLLEQNPNALTGNPIKPYTTIFHGKYDRKYLKAAQHWNSKIVDHPNENGRTPLHCACARDDLERAVELLSFGANVHKVGKNGNTPLHLAVSKNSEALVKLLLCFDADYTAKNNDGQAPIEMKSTVAIAKIFAQFVNSKKSSKDETGHNLPNLIQMKQDKIVEYQEALKPDVRSRSLRLLALDGGGIRGLCMAIMLVRIERETKSKRILDYFDWIAGTSTGAIFALSLAEGYSTLDCLRFYLRLKDEVFVGTRPHDPKPLESFLKECFGEKTMNQIREDKKVVVTTTKSDTNPPKLVMIRSYEMPNLVTLSIPPSQIKMWKAARCSSAAPSYFPSVDKQYLDGGLIANNPTPDLISDVHHHNFLRECEGNDPIPICCLLSLGTGRLPNQQLDSIDLEVSKGSGGLTSLLTDMTFALKTIKNLGSVFMEQLATSDGAVVERSRSWAHSLNIPYFRYTPQLDVECPLNTHENEDVIKLMWTAKLYAESQSQKEIDQIVRLIRAD